MIPAPTSLQPLPDADRLPILDVLRGFALMGILIMNMPGFSWSGWHEADGPRYWPALVALALFFGVQVPFSLWWLRHHRRGPVEAF